MFELEYIKKTDNFIAGTDEVGRGPLAGPVVSASAIAYGNLIHLEETVSLLREMGVTDSKKLTDKKRKLILENLNINLSNSTTWKIKVGRLNIVVSIDEKSPREIDRINILQASLTSMRDAFVLGLENINRKNNKGIVLIDGNKKFKNLDGLRIDTVVKGDSKSALIGLASVFAKVYRDEKMVNLAKKYPHYDFEKNAGYPTQKHRDAIKLHGITPEHRKSFKGVKEFVTQENF
jgi:ribonuclease HII